MGIQPHPPVALASRFLTYLSYIETHFIASQQSPQSHWQDQYRTEGIRFINTISPKSHTTALVDPYR